MLPICCREFGKKPTLIKSTKNNQDSKYLCTVIGGVVVMEGNAGNLNQFLWVNNPFHVISAFVMYNLKQIVNFTQISRLTRLRRQVYNT